MTQNQQRYFITLSYDGTNFSGWQFQPNHPSIQEEIENALTVLTRVSQKIIGCGRTDTGVHADYYIAHWDGPNELASNFAMKMNALLPRSISIHSITPVKDNAHARFDATSRKYHYFLHTRKNPFLKLYSYEFPFYNLDFIKMQEAAKILLEFDEFLPLIKLDKETKKTKCLLYTSEWIQLDEHAWRYEVSANRFLYNMVRRIVGTSIMIGRGKLSLESFRDSLIHQTPLQYINLAPANGLHLVDVVYPYPISLK